MLSGEALTFSFTSAVRSLATGFVAFPIVQPTPILLKDSESSRRAESKPN